MQDGFLTEGEMAKMEQERERFIAAQRNNDGDLIRFRTSAGRELDYGQALQEVQAGRIAGVNAFKAKDGQLHIRGDADGDPTNNLSELPQF